MAFLLYLVGAVTAVAGGLWTWVAFDGANRFRDYGGGYETAPAPTPPGGADQSINVYDLDTLGALAGVILALPGLATIVAGIVIMGLGHGLFLLGGIARNQRASARALAVLVNGEQRAR